PGATRTRPDYKVCKHTLVTKWINFYHNTLDFLYIFFRKGEKGRHTGYGVNGVAWESVTEGLQKKRLGKGQMEDSLRWGVTRAKLTVNPDW
ncbi:hypothetical protein, partial [uncultured Desulfovibrio sp.]|uniref:hypothetical protein n=1 Tax=uncultured Desulfovibrio sp. TaxID=167968 RepID=UPI00263721A7